MKQTFGLMTLACTLLMGCGGQDSSLNVTADQEQQVAARIAPIGHVNMAGQVVLAAAGAGAAAASGAGPRAAGLSGGSGRREFFEEFIASALPVAVGRHVPITCDVTVTGGNAALTVRRS